MESKFKPVDRKTPFLLPPSLVENCIAKEIKPFTSFGKEQHNFPLEERFVEPGPPPVTKDPVLLMKYRRAGKSTGSIRGRSSRTSESLSRSWASGISSSAE